MTALLSISMHRAPSHTHLFSALSSDEPKFALPMVLCAWALSQPRRFPLNSHNFIKEEWAEQGGAGRNKKKEGEKELCFPNHIPMGFQLRRWGRSKQFCLSCFCCVVLSFRGLFCFKLFLLRNRGVINADPLPITPRSRPFSLLFWEDSPW